MNRDVFLAILSMDSYSRGYDQKVRGLSSAAGTKIGNATVVDDRSDTIATDVGFYAIAYEWGSETVISYRGTDGASDLLNGWTTGAGWSDRAQARLAIDFYEAISGRWVHSPAAAPAVTLTGHSLGGGLADCKYANDKRPSLLSMEAA